MKNFLRWKSENKKECSDALYKKHIKEIASYCKKDISNNTKRKSIKVIKETSLLQKVKLTDYLKHISKETNIKCELKTLFLFIFKEYLLMIKNLNERFIQLEKENSLNSIATISFVKNIYEDENCSTVKDIIERITNEDEITDSYLLSQIEILRNANEFECIDVIFREADINEGVASTIDFIRILSKIQKISDNDYTKEDSQQKIINTTVNIFLPRITLLCFDLFEFSESKLINSMIELDQLRLFLNDICYFKHLRESTYDFLIRFIICCKDYTKINLLKKYIDENKCLEAILTHAINSFLSYCSNKQFDESIYDEIIFICGVYNLYIDNSSSLFIDKIVQLLVLIIEHQLSNDYNEEFESSLQLFFEKISALDYISKDNLKGKVQEKMISMSDILSNNQLTKELQKTELVSVMLQVFSHTFIQDNELSIKRIIMISLLKDINLKNYKRIIHRSKFLSHFVENIHQCNEEIISRYFNILIVLYENQLPDQSTKYYPLNEINSLVKTFHKINKEETLNLFLKHLQIFIDLGLCFQSIIANNGNYFIEIKKILDCSISDEAIKLKQSHLNQSLKTPFRVFESDSHDSSCNYRSKRKSTLPIIKYLIEDNEEETKAIYSCSMLLSLIAFIEPLITHHSDNYNLLKKSGLLDSNYYFKFAQHSEMKIITYKLWVLGIIYEPDKNEIRKNILFINQRYNKLKEDLLKMESNIENDSIILDYLKEINVINEIIGLKLFKDKDIRSNKEKKLINIILDFPILLNDLRDKFRIASTKRLSEDDKNNTSNIINDISAIEVRKDNSNENNYSCYMNESDHFGFWDKNKQTVIKIYLSVIMNMISNHNKRTFDFKFKQEKELIQHLSIPLKEKHIKQILILLIEVISYDSTNTYLHDFIKHIIDLSLRFKMNNSEEQKAIRISLRKKSFDLNKDALTESDELFNDNFRKYYSNKYSIDNKSMQLCDNSGSIYTNFSIKSPFLLVNTLIALHELKKYYELVNYIEMLTLIIRINENSARLLLHRSIVSIIIQIIKSSFEMKPFPHNECNESKCNCNIKLIENSITLLKYLMKYMEQNDLCLFFQFIHFNIKANVNKDLLEMKLNAFNQLLVDFHYTLKQSHKIKKGIIISNINNKQPNVYNMIYSTGINFFNSKIIDSESFDNKSKISSINIIISLKFHSFDNTKLVLFKLDKETKEKDVSIIEVIIENKRFTIRENDIDIASSKGSISHQITNGKDAKIIITLNKETNKIHLFLDYQHICTGSTEFKHLDLVSNASYTISLGYLGSCTKDIYLDDFQLLPHITLSYLMIYADQLSTDFSEQFSLSKLSSSKNGSILADQLRIKYLNYKAYKTLVPLNLRNNPKAFDINLNINPIKVVYELITDDIQLLTHNKIEQMKSEHFFMNNFLNKIQRQSYVDIMNKEFIPYIPYTNYYFKQNLLYSYVQHTFLLTKTLLSESLLFNEIFHINSIKDQILSNVITINSSIDYEIQHFNLIEHLLMILNACSSFKNQSKTKLILNILKIIGLYLVYNITELKDFCSKNEFKTLIIILSRNEDYLTKETIDLFFNLSFGLDEKTTLQLLDPWYPQFITEILLDINLFSRMPIDVKEHLITILTQFFTPIVSSDPDYQTKTTIVNKLYNIILSVKSTVSVDTKIVKLIMILIEQMFKCKTGVNTPNENQLKSIISYSREYLVMTDCFSQSLSCHLEKRNLNNEELNETTKIVKGFFDKLYSDDIKPIRNIISSYFEKLNSDCCNNHKLESILALLYQNEDNIKKNQLSKKTNRKANNVNSTTQDGECISLSIGASMQLNNEISCGEQVSTQTECNFCSYLLSRLNYEYCSMQYYFVFKKFLKHYYYNVNLDSRTNDLCLQSLGLSFSWNLYQREGPSRIRKKLILKMNVCNDELLIKENYMKNQNKKEIEIVDDFIRREGDFFRLDNKLDLLISLDQIFQLHFQIRAIKDVDKYESSFNCLLFKGILSSNCVFIIGERYFYFITNVHIDKSGILYKNIKPFSKLFWTLNDYSIEWNEQCSYLNMTHKSDEESEDNINQPLDRNEFKTYHFDYTDISELHKRKYLHQNNSIEIFLKNGKTILLAFNKDKRDQVYSSIIMNINALKRNLIINANTNLINSTSCFYLRESKLFVKKHKGKLKKSDMALIDIKSILDESEDKWANGFLSNYDYLMILNTLSGRNYNDISQYPVFPWIIKDFCTEGINLNDNDIYRNLTYPIYAQEKKTRDNLILKYECEDQVDNKYHSGTHYSTPGFISYYLIRLKPFSLYATEIQGGYFDTADRLFTNVKSIWDLSEKYQELIPEMYYLPEMFVNYNEFKFGMNLSKKTVNDVILPEWAKEDPRLFVKMTKKAMESCFVSEKINEWIDLVFGYKQQGKDAIEYLNIYRNACYPFDPNMSILKLKRDTTDAVLIKKLFEDLESKMNEIIEMGQNPTQLFTKAHPKREKHQKTLAFFSKCAYLMNFKLKEKQYKIQMHSFPTEIKGYFEIEESNLSQGQGGLSSFRRYYDNNTNNTEEHITKSINSMNTFFIVGNQRVLIGPKYQNFINYSFSKYSFSIVKPYDKVIMEFALGESSPISMIKCTTDGKKIIVAFSNGNITIFKLRKEYDNRIYHPDYEKKPLQNIKRESSNAINTIKTMISESHSYILNVHAFCKKDKGTKSFKQSNPFSSNVNEKIVEKEGDRKYIVNKKSIIPRISFMLSDSLKDYFVHSTTDSTIKKDLSYGCKANTLIIDEHSELVRNKIKLIEICESYTMLIVVDIINNIYLFDLCNLRLMRKLTFDEISMSNNDDTISESIKNIIVCCHTGDFAIVTSYQVFLLSVNGVLLAKLDIKERINKSISKITACSIKSLKSSESDIHFFTGHSNGSVIVWKLETNFGRENYINDEQNILDSYRYAYSKDYFNKNYQRKEMKLRITFDRLIEIDCKDKPIHLIKLTEDLSTLIIINKEMSLFYLSYEAYLDIKKKAKQLKICPQCSNPVGKSKIYCQLCNKKLCSFCKLEQKIPEYSLKSKRPICEDCSKMISSNNKMLYDF